MLRTPPLLLTAALLLAAPTALAEEPSPAPASGAAPAPPPTESGPSFSDRFFRGTSAGRLPTEKVALVAGLYVGAVASVAVGVATVLAAGSRHDDAESFKLSQPSGFCNDLASSSCATYRRLLGDERSARETGVMLLGVGGLLAVGGALTAELWHNDRTPEVAVACDGRGLSVGLSGRF